MKGTVYESSLFLWINRTKEYYPMSTGTATRGIRNNNPGNIRKGQPWQGLAPNQLDPAFDQFITPQYGIRAIVKIIQSYQNRGYDSIRKVINAWAPPNENNTTAYVDAVANAVGVDPDSCVNLQSLNVWDKLVKAIIMHENGQQPYPDAIIDAGIQMAL